MSSKTVSTQKQHFRPEWLYWFRAAVRVGWILLFAGAALVPMLGGTFYIRLSIEALLLGLLAMSVDILLGFAGLLSLGQAAWFGLAAYSAALLYLNVTQSLWLIAAIVCTGVSLASLALGTVILRSRGVYFALVTLGLCEILGKIVSNTAALGGSDGILGIKSPVLNFGLFDLPLGSNATFLYVTLFTVACVYFVVQRIFNSPFGAVFAGIHDNEQRVGYLGYDSFRYKLVAYVLAANVAALGGLLYPFLRGFVSPVLFSFEMSTKAVVMALVGGIGTLAGPIIGGVGITILESVVATFTIHHLIVIGAIFLVFVLYCPDGLAGLFRRQFQRAAIGNK